MYITDKKGFYDLPYGTLYSRWTPVVFGSLQMKLNNIFDEEDNPFDFSYININEPSGASDAIFKFLSSPDIKTDTCFLPIDNSYIGKIIPNQYNDMFEADSDNCYDSSELFSIKFKGNLIEFCDLSETQQNDITACLSALRDLNQYRYCLYKNRRKFKSVVRWVHETNKKLPIPIHYMSINCELVVMIPVIDWSQIKE